MGTVKSHFQNFSDAGDAMKKLKEKGFTNVYLDASSANDMEFAEEINPAGTEEGPSLSALVLRGTGANSEIGKGPLLASHPAVSGMGASRGSWHLPETNLTVHADDARLDEIRQILKEAGGLQF